jgi:cell division protein FtsN
MAADYKSRVNSKQKKSLPGYVWLLSGLAIGLFIAFIVYLDKQPANENDFGSAVQLELEKLKQQAKGSSGNQKPASKDATAEKKEQKFNFYTILPELEVLIPENETRPPEVKNNSVSSSTSTTSSSSSSSSTNKSDSAKQYILQVGSFQNLSDAEKLKANLAFLGIEADIQRVVVNSQAWHRVRTGPYRNKQQLYQNQKTLKQNNIDAISMELK